MNLDGSNCSVISPSQPSRLESQSSTLGVESGIYSRRDVVSEIEFPGGIIICLLSTLNQLISRLHVITSLEK
jgi:hypothetical protein